MKIIRVIIRNKIIKQIIHRMDMMNMSNEDITIFQGVITLNNRRLPLPTTLSIINMDRQYRKSGGTSTVPAHMQLNLSGNDYHRLCRKLSDFGYMEPLNPEEQWDTPVTGGEINVNDNLLERRFQFKKAPPTPQKFTQEPNPIDNSSWDTHYSSFKATVQQKTDQLAPYLQEDQSIYAHQHPYQQQQEPQQQSKDQQSQQQYQQPQHQQHQQQPQQQYQPHQHQNQPHQPHQPHQHQQYQPHQHQQYQPHQQQYQPHQQQQYQPQYQPPLYQQVRQDIKQQGGTAYIDPSTQLFSRTFDVGGMAPPPTGLERGSMNTRENYKNEYQQQLIAGKLLQSTKPVGFQPSSFYQQQQQP